MTGGERYWNEDAQRWEDGAGGGTPSVTPPPPPPPSFQPAVPEAGPGGVTDPDAPAGVAHAAPGGGWSVPEPPGPGAGPQGGRRRLVWGVLGGAAAAGVAVALVLTTVLDGGAGANGGDDRPSGTASAGESPTGGTEPGPASGDPTGPGPSSSGTASPSAGPSELPEGYELYRDPEGFTVVLPMGWERDTVPSQHGFDVVNYRSPDGFRRLQVYEVAEASPEESFELYLSDETPKPDGFQRVELVRLDGDVDGLRLEYLADSLRGEPEVGSWHVQDVRFRSPEDGKVYAVAAYGAPTDGADPELELALAALTYFCPPSATCATP